ncbi:hypothetical protein LOTGIDRAFT_161733 [Lottia gigantea]|uniref:Zonadhesin n=1 Tax=Lottia gigantea TaxID=225164 RepID=V4AA29_LOTGI|nr:hypothetical protein LOTGIDRAFT_161733 [Lottia gigantea]ESO93622.1 hypothetical protein LOTGIDRAFT_161733 [Lottia gigantea]
MYVDDIGKIGRAHQEDQEILEEIDLTAHQEDQEILEEIDLIAHQEDQEILKEIDLIAHQEDQEILEEVDLIAHQEDQEILEEVDLIAHQEDQEILEEVDLIAHQEDQEILEEIELKVHQEDQEILEEIELKAHQEDQEILEEIELKAHQEDQEILEEIELKAHQEDQEILEEIELKAHQEDQEILEEIELKAHQEDQEILEEIELKAHQEDQEILEEKELIANQEDQEILEERNLKDHLKKIPKKRPSGKSKPVKPIRRPGRLSLTVEQAIAKEPTVCKNPSKITFEPPEKAGDVITVDLKRGFKCRGACITRYSVFFTCPKDVDECAPEETGTNACSGGKQCSNTFGHFICKCPPGSELIKRKGICKSRNECSCSGDPHCLTYFGHKIDFMGKCKYLISGVCKAIQSNQKVWRVECKNTKCGKPNKDVTCTTWCETTIFKTGGDSVEKDVIRMERKGIMKVNGNRIADSQRFSNFDVAVSGKQSTLMTDFDLKVVFDGRSRIYVYAPDGYQGKLCGICGDIGADGSYSYELGDTKEAFVPVFKSKRNKVFNPRSALDYGNSWQVNDPADPKCKKVDKPTEGCSVEKDAFYRAPERCGKIRTLLEDLKSEIVLSEDQAKKFNPEEDIESCAFDSCAEESKADEIICDAVEGYASKLFKATGTTLEWRTDDFCSLNCGPKETPKLNAKCDVECGQERSILDSCDGEAKDRCVCKNPFRRKGTDCVSVSMCSCDVPITVAGAGNAFFKLQSGEEALNGDCSQKIRCANGKTTDIEAVTLDPNAECKVVDSRTKVVCNDHFELDANGKCVSQGECSFPFIELENKCVYVTGKRKTWREAVRLCNALGGHLLNLGDKNLGVFNDLPIFWVAGLKADPTTAAKFDQAGYENYKLPGAVQATAVENNCVRFEPNTRSFIHSSCFSDTIRYQVICEAYPDKAKTVTTEECSGAQPDDDGNELETVIGIQMANPTCICSNPVDIKCFANGAEVTSTDSVTCGATDEGKLLDCAKADGVSCPDHTVKGKCQPIFNLNKFGILLRMVIAIFTNVKLLQTSSYQCQAITNFIFTMSSYYKLLLHNVKLLQTSPSQCQANTNFFFLMSRYYKLRLHNVKLLQTSPSQSQAITNFIFTMSSYNKLHLHNVKLLQTSSSLCQAITNFFPSMSSYYKLHLHYVKLLQTSFPQCQAITNFFFTMSSYYKLHLYNVMLLQTSSSQCQAITNFFLSMSSYYKLLLHNVKLLQTSPSQCQANTNFFFLMSRYYKLRLHNVKLLQTSPSQSQAITNFIFTMSSYNKLHLHNVKLLQTSSSLCQAITNFFPSMSSYYKLHLHYVKLLQTSFPQCQAITNFFFTMSSYYKLHLYNVMLLQTSSSQCQAITNFFLSMSSYYKLHLHNVKLLQTPSSQYVNECEEFGNLVCGNKENCEDEYGAFRCVCDDGQLFINGVCEETSTCTVEVTNPDTFKLTTFASTPFAKPTGQCKLSLLKCLDLIIFVSKTADNLKTLSLKGICSEIDLVETSSILPINNIMVNNNLLANSVESGSCKIEKDVDSVTITAFDKSFELTINEDFDVSLQLIDSKSDCLGLCKVGSDIETIFRSCLDPDTAASTGGGETGSNPGQSPGGTEQPTGAPPPQPPSPPPPGPENPPEPTVPGGTAPPPPPTQPPSPPPEGPENPAGPTAEVPIPGPPTEPVPPPAGPDQCNTDMSADDKCGIVTDAAGPFSGCGNAKDIFDLCLRDICMQNMDICQALVNAQKACVGQSFTRELVVAYKMEAGCEEDCPENMIFSFTPPPPSSCKNKHPVVPEERPTPPPGCFCKPGFYLEEGECIPSSQCGCVDKDGLYHELDDVWFSDGCSTMFSCKAGSVKTLPYTLIENSNCGQVDNKPYPECSKGFMGVATELCNKVEEKDDSYCADVPDGDITKRVCLCKKGFVSDCESCVDLDECQTGFAKCGANEKCVNLRGNYTCECAPGYERGNLGVCININECQREGMGMCQPNSKCIDLPGRYSCACCYGYKAVPNSISEFRFTCQRDPAILSVGNDCCICNTADCKPPSDGNPAQVCGTDGIEYDNYKQLYELNCAKNGEANIGVGIASYGSCRKEGTTTSTTSTTTSTTTTTPKPPSVCDSSKICSQAERSTDKPCCNGGNRYKSFCEMRMSMCLKNNQNPDIPTTACGNCFPTIKPPTTTPVPTPSESDFEPWGPWKECQPRPSGLPCGTANGVKYRNRLYTGTDTSLLTSEMLRQQDSCDLHPCPSDTPQPEVPNPCNVEDCPSSDTEQFCGKIVGLDTQPKTYKSRCHLERNSQCQGLEISKNPNDYYPGICSPGGTRPLSLPCKRGPFKITYAYNSLDSASGTTCSADNVEIGTCQSGACDEGTNDCCKAVEFEELDSIVTCINMATQRIEKVNKKVYSAIRCDCVDKDD